MITTLTLQNFRSYKDPTQFDSFARINLVRGPNGCGKTSIQLALEYLLTGRCAVTDEAGRGAELLITHGAKELSIAIELAGAGHNHVTRTRSRNGGTLTIPPDLIGRQAEAWIADHIGSPDVLSAVLNSSRFLGMSPKEQKAMLLAALPAARVPLSEELKQAMTQAGFVAVSEISSAVQAENIYKQYYEHRTDLNRQIKALGDVQSPQAPKGMPDPAEHGNKVIRLKRERDQIVGERQKKLSEHKANQDRLAVARKQLETFEPHILEDKELKFFQGVVSKTETIKRLTHEVSELVNSIHYQEDQVLGLGKQPDTCPTCGHALDVSDTKKQIARLEEDIAADRKTLEKKQAELLKAGDLETANQKLAAHRQALAATHSAQQITDQLKDLPAIVDVSELDLELERLDSQLNAAGEQSAELSRYQGQLSQYEQSLSKLQSLRNQLAPTEKVIQALSETGPIRTQLVGSRMGEFKASLLAALDHFGFCCELSFEPYSFKVLAAQSAQASLDISQLSESEAFRFAVAFQIALAEATHSPLVVIDRSDVLLPSLRPLLSTAVLNSSVEQIFILVAAENPMEAPPPEGVRVFELGKDVEGHTVIRNDNEVVRAYDIDHDRKPTRIDARVAQPAVAQQPEFPDWPEVFGEQ